jgi:aspartate aminotransferase
MVNRLGTFPRISVVNPKGAFYVMANISQFGLSSTNFADRLLSKHHVAVVPGVAFGDDRLIRLSYATSLDVIKKGLDRIEEFVKSL